MNTPPEDLKSQMLTEAMLILNSVAFLEKQVYNKIAEIEEATNNNLYEDVERLEMETKALLRKIQLENSNMDSFTKKYQERVNNEKKAILSSIKQKK
jgi:hypothetical protein